MSERSSRRCVASIGVLAAACCDLLTGAGEQLLTYVICHAPMPCFEGARCCRFEEGASVLKKSYLSKVVGISVFLKLSYIANNFSSVSETNASEHLSSPKFPLIRRSFSLHCFCWWTGSNVVGSRRLYNQAELFCFEYDQPFPT